MAFEGQLQMEGSKTSVKVKGEVVGSSVKFSETGTISVAQQYDGTWSKITGKIEGTYGPAGGAKRGAFSIALS